MLEKKYLRVFPNSMIPQLENPSLDVMAQESVRNWDGPWRKRADEAIRGKGIVG
jgi:hypothetical protein